MKIQMLLAIFFGISVIAAEPDYHADVAPFLRDYCAGCHNESDYDGDFSIETFAALMEGGESADEKPILKSGDAANSFLYHLLTKTGKGAMPPKKEPQPSAEEIAVIERWINSGAKGPDPKNDHSVLSTLNVTKIAPKPNKTAKPITAAEFSPDGKWFVIARFGAMEIQDAGTGKIVREIPNQSGKINAIHFSPDGSKLVTASGITGLKGVATIYEFATGKKLAEIGGEKHRDILFDAEFSPDGKLLATAGYDRVIRLWNVADGKYIRQIKGHNGAVFDVAFSPDGTLLASASGDSTGKIWLVATGERLDTLNQPQGEQFRIAFTPDGKFIVGAGADNRIRLWRLLSKTKPKINPVIHARFGHEAVINDFAMSRDGKWLATASSDDSVKLWTLPDLKQSKMFGQQPDLVSVLAFFPKGGGFKAARMDGTIQPYSFDEHTLLSRETKKMASRSNPVDSTNVQGPIVKVPETESAAAQMVSLPVEIAGSIGAEGDRDDFKFSAKAGQRLVLEVDAARSKSLLDSKIEVLTADGKLIERVVLQALRDSWFTFRGKNSDTSDDFRVHNWREMELNEFLFANGEVVKLWQYPRGPDSGFKVYPGFGNRHTFFDTTPLSHPLGEPCYIVRALPPGADPSPNGLPIYRIYFENDDEARRTMGKDSKLTFTAPADGEYVARISDVRGFGAAEKFDYKLLIRAPKPDFVMKVGGKGAMVSPGSGKELIFTATRLDDFDGAITVDIKNLPKGFSASTPVVIEAGQDKTVAVLNATPDLTAAVMEDVKNKEGKVEKKPKAIPAVGWEKVKVVATGMIGGKPVMKDLGDLGKIAPGVAAKVLVRISPDGDHGKVGADGVLEFEIEPGETITATVEIERREKFEGIVNFGKEDAGRGLGHGGYIANTGLNGLMLHAKQTKQRFFIAASPVAAESERLFFLRSNVDGNQASSPVRLRVVRRKAEVSQN